MHTALYRRRSDNLVVEAMHYDGTQNTIGDAVAFMQCRNAKTGFVIIRRGDWIIKVVDGDCFACNTEEFRRDYEECPY